MAGALGRATYVRIHGQAQFPNIYLLLVGLSGTGKTNALRHATPLLENTKRVHLTPVRITRQAFYDEIEEAAKSGFRVETNIRTGDGPHIEASASLTAHVNEMGVFIHKFDFEFQDELTDLYDNPAKFKYKTRTAGKAEANNVCFNLALCTTPKSLAELFNDASMEKGLSSRFIMVWADRLELKDPFEDHSARGDLRIKLQADLTKISTLSGEYLWSADSMAFAREWVASGLAPKIPDQRFDSYHTRRFSHFAKLALIIAAARHDEPVIHLEDAVAARTILLSAEVDMPACLGGGGGNPLHEQMKLAVKVTAAFMRRNDGNPVPEAQIRRAIQREVPVNMMSYLFDALARMGWLIPVSQGEGVPPRWLANMEDQESWSR